MKVVLFQTDWRSLLSIIICAATGTRHSHAAIIVDGVMYDAFGQRGNIDVNNLYAFIGRRIEVFDVADTDMPMIKQYINSRIEEKYDFIGVAGWLFGFGNSKRSYCFEFVMEVLDVALYEDKAAIRRTDSSDIIKRLSKPEYTGLVDNYAN